MDEPKPTAGDLVARRRDLVTRLNDAERQLADAEAAARRSRERVEHAVVDADTDALASARAARQAADAALAHQRDLVAGLQRAVADVTAVLADSPAAGSDVVQRLNQGVVAETAAIETEWRAVATKAGELIGRGLALSNAVYGITLGHEMVPDPFPNLRAARVPHSLTDHHALQPDSDPVCYRGDSAALARAAKVPERIAALVDEARSVVREREQIERERRAAQAASRMAAE